MKTDLNIIYWYACYGAMTILIESLEILKDDSKIENYINKINKDIKEVEYKHLQLALTINKSIQSMNDFIIHCESLEVKYF